MTPKTVFLGIFSGEAITTSPRYCDATSSGGRGNIRTVGKGGLAVCVSSASQARGSRERGRGVDQAEKICARKKGLTHTMNASRGVKSVDGRIAMRFKAAQVVYGQCRPGISCVPDGAEISRELQSGIKLLLPLRFSEHRGIKARAKRACRVRKYNLTMTQTKDTKLLYKRDLVREEKRRRGRGGKNGWKSRSERGYPFRR